MTEIKYRQFHPSHDVNGFELPSEFHYWGYVHPEYPNTFTAPVSSADAKLSQAYTGLKDKNGKEIYEGDVISYLYGAGIDSTSVVRYEAEHAGFSPFYDEGWYCRVSEYEVVGNIYENQNLLESTE